LGDIFLQTHLVTLLVMAIQQKHVSPGARAGLGNFILHDDVGKILAKILAKSLVNIL
jgi:hypothetical protein